MYFNFDSNNDIKCFTIGCSQNNHMLNNPQCVHVGSSTDLEYQLIIINVCPKHWLAGLLGTLSEVVQ